MCSDKISLKLGMMSRDPFTWFLDLSTEELVSISLYGDEVLPFESNRIIIKATLDFIESSNRFSQGAVHPFLFPSFLLLLIAQAGLH